MTKTMPQDVNIAPRALKVGDRLNDGTVVLSLNRARNEALLVPKKIFGYVTNFENQDYAIKEYVNKCDLHGHDDWRPITDTEGEELARVWDKVAPPEMQGHNAPLFWLRSREDINSGHVCKGSEPALHRVKPKEATLPVPVVRSAKLKHLAL